MSNLSEAHSHWHSQFPDTPWDCPLDCGMADRYDDDYMDPDAVEVYREDVDAHIQLFEPHWGEEPFPDWQD